MPAFEPLFDWETYDFVTGRTGEVETQSNPGPTHEDPSWKWLPQAPPRGETPRYEIPQRAF